MCKEKTRWANKNKKNWNSKCVCKYTLYIVHTDITHGMYGLHIMNLKKNSVFFLCIRSHRHSNECKQDALQSFKLFFSTFDRSFHVRFVTEIKLLSNSLCISDEPILDPISAERIIHLPLVLFTKTFQHMINKSLYSKNCLTHFDWTADFRSGLLMRWYDNIMWWSQRMSFHFNYSLWCEMNITWFH